LREPASEGSHPWPILGRVVFGSSAVGTRGIDTAMGQGNYESLAGTDRPVFFLFAIKCPVVSRQVGASVGTLVVRREGKVTPQPRTTPPGG